VVADGFVATEDPMHPLLTRHAVQVLRRAGLTQEDVAAHCKLSVRTVRRIEDEEPVSASEDGAEAKHRGIGRPTKLEAFRPFVITELAAQPDVRTLELLRRAREKGYTGGQTTFYGLVKALRGDKPDFIMRFEGLPGEFSQHDFGQVDVTFLNGMKRRIRFFASRLKWSRFAQVTLVDDETSETLVRTLLEHFVAFGGVPLCAVFDRPKTVAVKWRADGTVTEWCSTFGQASLDIGFCPEVCWPRSPRQKGSVENLVGWVKGSFFKQRRFHDFADLLQQLAEWHREVNFERPSRATGVIPSVRLAEEKPRLRAPRVGPEELALRVPLSVGPTAYVIYEGHPYSMPPRAAGLSGTLYVYKDRVRLEAGRFEATHARAKGKQPSTLPEHRAAQLSAVSGQRGKRYLKRQHIFDLGEPAVVFLTALVHDNPKGWSRDVDLLHELLERVGPDPLVRALRAAVDIGAFDVDYVKTLLPTPQTLLRGVAA
jgi:transposase